MHNPLSYPHNKSRISNISTDLCTLSTKSSYFIQVIHIALFVDLTAFLLPLHNSTKIREYPVDNYIPNLISLNID